jgi:hypothetical protein
VIFCEKAARGFRSHASAMRARRGDRKPARELERRGERRVRFLFEASRREPSR